MKKNVITDFTRWREGVLDTDAQRIALKMKDNLYFPTLTNEVAAVANASLAYHEAYLADKDGGKEAHNQKIACRKALEKALRVLGLLINAMADGDQAILDSTGYPLSKAVVARRKAKEEIGLKEDHRSVTVTLKGHPEAGGYLLQYTAAPVTGDSEWMTVCMTSTTTVISGLETDKKYAFRLAYVIHDQGLEFSEPVISWYVK